MNDLKRVSRTKEQAKINYDRLSKWYDFLAGGSEKKFRDTGLRKLAVKPGERVLEVGFGTGYCILSLAQSVGKDGKVVGLELSEGMIRRTLARLKKVGLADRVKLQCGDAVIMPFADDYFDAIFISFTLELFDTPEIPLVLRQLRRVLKNGGRLCVVSMSNEGNSGMMVRLYEWAHQVLPRFVDCRPIYARQAMEEARFAIVDASISFLLRLPIEIILARK
jgi:ubiquinone/menaquinone biosynthesis C-methylase UbiE